MRLSPLQSRLVASLAASLVVLALYLLLLSPNLAFAAELPHPADVLLDLQLERSRPLQLSYEPDFAPFDRGIIGRATADTTSLTNNEPKELNLLPGATACYVVDSSVLYGSDASRAVRSVGVGEDGTPKASDMLSSDEGPSQRRAATPKSLYISVNTCLQPTINGSDTPPLTLYVTNSSDVGCPSATDDSSKTHSMLLDQGAAMYTLNATDDIYISVVAPNVTVKDNGIWNFRIAASLNDYYYRYYTNDTSELLWMDSDSTSALLLSRNLTENADETSRILKEAAPYELFVQNQNYTAINGLGHSVCGLQQNAPIGAIEDGEGKMSNLVTTTLTTRGPGGFPKQQFYFEGLNASSSYIGVLVKSPKDSDSIINTKEGTSGGGGVVFAQTPFQTTIGSNCRVVVDLDFCDDIQYAVPGNNDNFNGTALAKTYDEYARKMYDNFKKVMMQIPCEADSTSRYSLVRNCDDCAKAYKSWLCTVSLPRCEDINSDSAYTFTRNAGQAFPNGTMLPAEVRQQLSQPYHNTSRNRFIDEVIRPGPYKEILPCEDICYEVVQSCPAAIGFTCPQPHMAAFKSSYGRRSKDDHTVSCNYPGEARTPISAGLVVAPRTAVVWLVGVFVTRLILR